MIKLKPSYKPLEITLIKKDMKKSDLRGGAFRISPSTLAKMWNGEYIALTVIQKLCENLECRIEEVVEFISADEQPEQKPNT